MNTRSESSEQVKRVPCPVCDGAGRLSYQKPGGCLCCNGRGTITESESVILARIRKDLAARLS